MASSNGHLAGPDGEAINAILYAADHNICLLTLWTRLLLLIALTKYYPEAKIPVPETEADYLLTPNVQKSWAIRYLPGVF